MTTKVRNAIAVSLAVQGLGSLSPLVTVLALARIAGPETQAVYSTFKTWQDLVSSLIVFGFPQAFVYLINKNIAPKDSLLNFSLLYTALTTVLVVPIAAYSTIWGYNILPTGQSLTTLALMLAFGVGTIVLHRLVRAIYLTIDDGVLFSLITSAPAFFQLVTMVAVTQAAVYRYDLAFAVAGALTLLVVGIWMRRIVGQAPNYAFTVPVIPKRALMAQSTHSFFQSISFTLQPVMTIALLRLYGAGLSDIAFFTSATILITAVNVFFGIVSPILFNRWSVSLDAVLLGRIMRMSDRLALLFLLASAAAIPLLVLLVPMVFGASYTDAVPAFQIVALAMAPVAFTRTVISAIHAAGRPGINTWSCGVRLAVTGVAQIALSQAGMLPPLLAAVTAWMIAEWVSAIYSRQTGLGIVRGIV